MISLSRIKENDMEEKERKNAGLKAKWAPVDTAEFKHSLRLPFAWCCLWYNKELFHTNWSLLVAIDDIASKDG